MPCTGSTSIMRDVAGRQRELLLQLGAVDDQRVGQAERREALLEDLGLALVERGLVPDDDLAALWPWPTAHGASARARTFLGRSCAKERATGPWALPPPRNCGTRAEPWRAEPVPFCLYIFLPVRQTSARPIVACEPSRRLASW